MDKNSIEEIKQIAENCFYNGDYKGAMKNFSLALMKSPEDKESQIGAILTDMATENEQKAQAIFEYYQITKEIESENAEDIIESLINSFDMDLDLFSQMIEERDNPFDSFEDDYSINYRDFIEHIQARGDFKTAYQDIMFSTKVLIKKREDFMDFLERLIDNGYKEAALGYLEAAANIFPKDMKIQELFKKVKNSDNKA